MLTILLKSTVYGVAAVIIVFSATPSPDGATNCCTPGALCCLEQRDCCVAHQPALTAEPTIAQTPAAQTAADQTPRSCCEQLDSCCDLGSACCASDSPPSQGRMIRLTKLDCCQPGAACCFEGSSCCGDK